MTLLVSWFRIYLRMRGGLYNAPEGVDLVNQISSRIRDGFKIKPRFLMFKLYCDANSDYYLRSSKIL